MSESPTAIPFNAQDPFPLLEIGTYTYAMAKQHAVLVDDWLKLRTSDIEHKLKAPIDKDSFPQERWIGLDPQSFLTPYIEIRTMLDLLNPQAGEKIIDLGCGYGRMGHVIGRHYPQVFFVGYELVSERIFEAQKSLKPFSYGLVRFEVADLVQRAPETADIYFIYDYGSKDAIEKTLQDLQAIARTKKIKVVGRGRATRFLIHKNHPWLGEVNPPEHFETFSIYHS